MSVSVSVCGSRSIPIPTFLFRCSLGGLIPRQLLLLPFAFIICPLFLFFFCPLDLFSFIFILTLFQRGQFISGHSIYSVSIFLPNSFSEVFRVPSTNPFTLHTHNHTLFNCLCILSHKQQLIIERETQELK